jgi:large subunit ribosomal protein L9
MKVILCEDVDNLGDMGETVIVAPGYARNYLLPRKLAVPMESSSAKQIAHEMAIIKRREEKRRVELKKVAGDLQGVTVEIKMRAGENEKLFGSVTPANIVEQLELLGYKTITRKQIQLPEHIKQLGLHKVPVKLGGGVTAELKVLVSPIEPEKPAESEATEASAAPASVELRPEDTV